MYLETQDKLKARKLDDLEQYGHLESLRFNGFQTKQTESSEDCAKMVKQYIRNTLKAEVNDNDFNRIHQIQQKYRRDDGKECQQVTVKFKGFRGHPLSTYAKFSDRLIFLTPCYAHVRVRIRELDILVFRKTLRTYLMDHPLSQERKYIEPESINLIFLFN